MKQVIKYEAIDGTIYDTAEEAEKHEYQEYYVSDILKTWDNFDVYIDSRLADEMARIIVKQYALIKK